MEKTIAICHLKAMTGKEINGSFKLLCPEFAAT